MTKKLYFEDTAKEKLKKGFDKLAKAVCSTLGPNGKTVIIELDSFNRIITKDGVTVAKNISLVDPVENLAAQMLKEASLLTNKEAGDGTTTSTVLAKEILDLGFEELKSRKGFDIKNELELDLVEVLHKLDKVSRKCKKADIKRVAKVSTNGDNYLSNLITDLYNKAKDSEIILEPSLTTDTHIDFVEGYSFNSSYIDSFFINSDKNQVKYEKPLYFIYDGKLNSAKSLLRILDLVSKTERPLVIIAEEVSTDVLHTCFRNHQSNKLKNVIIKTPGFGPVRKQYLNDIAVYTKGEIINESTIKDFNLPKLGQSEKIVVKEDVTLIKKGNSDPKELEAYIKNLEYLTKNNSDHNKGKIKERISKFKSGIGIIYVGAKSELEYKERYDRIEDAVNAVRAALEEGIIVGAGIALHTIGEEKDTLLYRAIRKPFILISENLNEINIVEIIDPVKVTKVALKNAVSVASTILTTETVIVNE